MNPWLIFLAIAAALTILWSPSVRQTGLRLAFMRDMPKTPTDWAPKFHTYHEGVRVA